MRRMANALLVMQDAYLSVDIALGIEALFPAMRLHQRGGTAAAIEVLPLLPEIDLAVFDTGLAEIVGSGLARMLAAQGAVVAIVASAIGPEAEAEARRAGVLPFFFSADLMRHLAGLTGGRTGGAEPV